MSFQCIKPYLFHDDSLNILSTEVSAFEWVVNSKKELTNIFLQKSAYDASVHSVDDMIVVKVFL